MRFYSSSTRQYSWLAVLLPALLLCPGEVAALGLGELAVRSRLGARFHAEVQLIDSAGDTRSSAECFRLSLAGEAESGIPVLTGGRISLERQHGQSKLIITSDQSINEPVLQVNLRAGCGTEVVRSYTVLIDPATSQPLTRPTSTPLPLASKSPETEKPSPSQIAQKPYPKVWQAVEGESAQSITRALFPRQPSAQRRFLAALTAENPQFDLGVRGEMPLEAGTTLNVPDTRRRIPVTPPVEVGEMPTPKEARLRDLPAPVRREKASVRKPAGRMADRLVISGDSEEDNSGPELPLRLSTDLSSRRPSKVSENGRTLLRVEYKLLNALYVQAAQQLAIAEQVRNLEASFEEMRAATENAASNTDAAITSAASAEAPVAGNSVNPSVPVEAGPTSTPVQTLLDQPEPKRKGSPGWWLEILIILGLIGTLTWALVRRSSKRKPALSPILDDEALHIPLRGNKSDPHDPWAGEDEQETIQHTKTSGIIPDIVLDDAPAPSPGGMAYERHDLPLKHFEVDESGDFSTAMELAEIMIVFGRIKGAIQALEEFLAHKPAESLAPWLKLLEIFRMNDMREEFETCSVKLRSHFNVAPASWEEAGECLREPIALVNEQDVSIEELIQKLPMIGSIQTLRDEIQSSWGSPEGLTYLNKLLRDNRDGTRSGLPLAIARELLFLVDLLEARLQNKP